MLFMNEWEIEEAVYDFLGSGETPNLGRAAQVLNRLSYWANTHSDGWAHWPKPARAAKSLMTLLEQKRRDYREDGCVFRDGQLVRFTDASDADLKKALAPIKAFLTRQHVDHGEVL